MASKSKVEDFLRNPVKNFSLLWIPVLFSMLAEPMTGLVDTAFIARLGPEALAALGVGTVLLSSGMWLFNFLSVGSQTEVAQAKGRQELGQGKRFASLALLFAVAIGLVLTLSGLLLAPLMSTYMGAVDQVHEYAVTYIQIRALGSPAVLITMTSFGILYGLADMRSPLLIAIAVNAMNIILDYVFIFGLGPVPALGIAGAAIASTVSQWTGAVWACYSISRQMGFTLNVDTRELKKLVKIAQDMFVRTGSLVMFLLLATRSATTLGADAGAAHQAIRQVWVFTALFLDASAITGQSIIGYFFGSGQIKKARKVARMVCYLSICIGFILMGSMLLGAPLVASLLVPPSGLAFFYPAWKITALMQPAASLAFVTDGIHWGTGDFKYLRNVVVSATLFGILCLVLMDLVSVGSLSLIWGITGAWIVIRAALGLLRIWPGSKNSPLRVSVQPV